MVIYWEVRIVCNIIVIEHIKYKPQNLYKMLCLKCLYEIFNSMLLSFYVLPGNIVIPSIGISIKNKNVFKK